MNTLLRELRAAILATLLITVVACGLYPLLVYGIAQAAFPAQANGSLMTDSHGVVRGSRLLGQHFSGAGYFHSRPSAAGAGYDAANSGGSNLGPTSRRLYESIQERLVAYRAENWMGPKDPVPADAVTASASGLDPHISPDNAALQVARVARTRGISEATVRALVQRCTDGRSGGFLGEPGVNVLALNLALDSL